MMMPLRVLRQMSDLKMAVEVGFVVGITAPTRPTGSAILRMPNAVSSSMTPHVFMFLYVLKMYSAA